jgi:hypothetical protein
MFSICGKARDRHSFSHQRDHMTRGFITFTNMAERGEKTSESWDRKELG